MALSEIDHLKKRILRVKARIPSGQWGRDMRKMFPGKYDVGTAGAERLKNTYRVRTHHLDVIEDLETLADSLKQERAEARKAKGPDKPRRAVVKSGQDKILTRAQAARGG